MLCPLQPGYVLLSGGAGSQSVPGVRLCCPLPEYQSGLLFPDDICLYPRLSVHPSRYEPEYVQQLPRYAFWEYRFRWLWPYRPVSRFLECVPKPYEPVRWSTLLRSKNRPTGPHSYKSAFLPECKSEYYVQYVPRSRSEEQLLRPMRWYAVTVYVPMRQPWPRYKYVLRC